MKKTLAIALKDFQLMLNDPTALLLMLATPFALTLVIAFAFGGGSGSGSGLGDIPLIVVNQDRGQLGASLVEVFQSADLADLLEPQSSSDPQAARSLVDRGEAYVAVIIPAGFSAAILPGSGEQAGGQAPPARAPADLELYSDPAAPVSTGIVRSVVDEFLNRVYAGVTSAQVTITQLITSGRLDPAQAAALGAELGQGAADETAGSSLLVVKTANADTSETGGGFDWLTYSAPSMAILFLMFTVTAGGRTILVERDSGTLPRLLTTPTTAAQVLGGKALGIYNSGIFQMVILYLASLLVLRVSWGAPGLVLVLVLALVAAATGWGLLIAAVARTPGQANAMGTAISLIFAISAGNFIPRVLMPGWLQSLGLITPNALGLEGIAAIRSGVGLAELAPILLALMGMAVVLVVISVLIFRRQYR